MPTNHYKTAVGGSTDSSGIHFSVTPHDTNPLPKVTRALYVGTGGNIAIADMRGNEEIYVNVPDGATLFIRATRVLDTDTTADDIVGLA